MMKKEYKVPFINVSVCPTEHLADITFDGSVGRENAIPLPDGPAEDIW